ncbi:hypothetical protein ElyMa_000539700 [Elysia marginata]|uniref:Uncharacterized protein n=1 Tax=Elysia marginata TaxID=1093978 RepID=A0AAV4G0V6_9GAST|nr:hypothetical protein ElyMa_000539700 [Elysia marginata]
MTALFSTQPVSGFSWDPSPPEDLDTIETGATSEHECTRTSVDLDRLEPGHSSCGSTKTSTQPAPQFETNGSENRVNSFYLALMGDQLSSSLLHTDRTGGSRPTAACEDKGKEEDSSNPGSSHTGRSSKLYLGGQKYYNHRTKLEKERREDHCDKQTLSDTLHVADIVDGREDPRTDVNSDCSGGVSYPLKTTSPGIPKSAPTISSSGEDEESLSVKLAPGQARQTAGVNCLQLSVQEDDGGDDACSDHTLSVIMEEDEDVCHEDFYTREHSRSQLLPDNSHRFDHVDQHTSQSHGVDSDDRLENRGVDSAKIDVLTLVDKSSLKLESGRDSGLPLFDLRAKMSRTQTVQVAALMAVGAILVAAILVWVFSPVILAI